MLVQALRENRKCIFVAEIQNLITYSKLATNSSNIKFGTLLLLRKQSIIFVVPKLKQPYPQCLSIIWVLVLVLVWRWFTCKQTFPVIIFPLRRPLPSPSLCFTFLPYNFSHFPAYEDVRFAFSFFEAYLCGWPINLITYRWFTKLNKCNISIFQMK